MRDADDLTINDEPVIYYQVVASSTVWGNILNVTMNKEDNVQLNEIKIDHY